MRANRTNGKIPIIFRDPILLRSIVQYKLKKGALLQYIFQSSHFINSPVSPFDIPHLTHISSNMTIIEVMGPPSFEQNAYFSSTRVHNSLQINTQKHRMRDCLFHNLFLQQDRETGFSRVSYGRFKTPRIASNATSLCVIKVSNMNTK